MSDHEFLKFQSAGAATREEPDIYWRADIHCHGQHSWLARINAWGETAEQAEMLRDRILWALNNPVHPELFQYEDKEHPGVWHICADIGEAVRAKANGHNTRGLYLKSPLVPN